MKIVASAMPASPIGMLIRKIQCQEIYVVMKRPDQRRQGDPHHGIDQLAPVDAAHENEARDRCHHCAPHALDDPRRHELIE